MAAIAISARRRVRALPAGPRYLAGRLGQAVLALFGVTTIVFFALRLSGDPARLLVPEGASAADIERVREQLGLTDPLWRQYLSFLGGAVHGDLGFSYVQNRPATELIAERLPYTANLAVAALLLSIVFGVTVGVVTALKRGRWQERALMPVVLVGQAMPAFWTGLLLILVFSVGLRWLPSTGYDGPLSLLLPSVTLASLSAAAIARVTRGSVLEQLSRDYVRTARAKGAGTGRIVLRHLARNSAIPVLTVAGLELANLLGGAVVTEVIFAWPGLGQLTIQSVSARDFPVVQAIVVFASAVYIGINLLTDLLYGVIDRRVTVGGAA
ncbi:ABC transporter permease [Actinomadura darangshiensis]|uniref:ABC transporter permease n=1 Tax=Actinomadura darangshiensis TaxID=705336 RepID=A0A4R5BIX3_9ACTN|nr:ABC transporter permease [Actinomadura darangshiensis]TDD83794.1 ABC transporter permease [Actinomadura darangshiensis]